MNAPFPLFHAWAIVSLIVSRSPPLIPRLFFVCTTLETDSPTCPTGVAVDLVRYQVGEGKERLIDFEDGSVALISHAV